MKTMKPEYFEKLENYINEYQQKWGYSPSTNDMVRDLEIPKTTEYRYITYTKSNKKCDNEGEDEE